MNSVFKAPNMPLKSSCSPLHDQPIAHDQEPQMTTNTTGMMTVVLWAIVRSSFHKSHTKLEHTHILLDASWCISQRQWVTTLDLLARYYVIDESQIWLDRNGWVIDLGWILNLYIGSSIECIADRYHKKSSTTTHNAKPFKPIVCWMKLMELTRLQKWWSRFKNRYIDATIIK